MLTTLYVSSQGMIGKLPLTPPQGNRNTLLCHLALTNAPAVFQALINEVLQWAHTCSTSSFFVYLDDI